jgi:NAD(P)-dependent dehydrogenase (short-subunit alcohol dehydrogenase family)
MSQRVVVTGAGSGLGRAFCTLLAKQGARILASDVNLAAAEETARLTGANAIACDVSRVEDVTRVADEAERLWGGVDLVVNNAGVAVAGRMGEVSLEDWHWVFNINLWGVIHGCHVFVPRLRAQKSGRIINVASAAGLLSPPQMAPYNVTKAAVVALSETLHGELRDEGIGVTVVCPTYFPTNIHKNERGVTDPRLRAMLTRLIEAGKLTAEDVAKAALDGAAAGELYVTPQPDGRFMWQVKRMMPTSFHKLGPKAAEAEFRKLGVIPPE